MPLNQALSDNYVISEIEQEIPNKKFPWVTQRNLKLTKLLISISRIFPSHK